MIPKFIQTSNDLQTQHRDICNGFLSQALAKVEKADPYIAEAKRFYEALTPAQSIEDLLSEPI